MDSTKWEAVIGLEIHAQLATQSKMFSPDLNQFGDDENKNIHPVSLALPGALPVLNWAAVQAAVKVGFALGCQVATKSVFARKNYFYPDLPKGYQISQYDQPICHNGKIDIEVDDYKKTIGITRAHLEEDAGKSIHTGRSTLINLNRAGVPLLEIVSEPDLRTPAEAAQYARTIRQILRYLEVCDGNLEQGSLRCDCNVSVRKKGSVTFGTKVEIKNINSFRFVEKAIEFEIERQIAVIEAGEKVNQETRLFDPGKEKTFVMRSKEEAHDYRYFPDPDLPPIIINEAELAELKMQLPELPTARVDRFVNSYGLPVYDAQVLTQDKPLADYFETVVIKTGNPKVSSNWVMGEFLRNMNEAGIDVKSSPVSAERLGELIQLIDTGKISGKIAKTVFQEMWQNPRSPQTIVEELGLAQVSDEKAIEDLVMAVINENPDQVAQFRAGKDKLFGFFVGQAMKKSKGQANPELLNAILKTKLQS